MWGSNKPPAVLGRRGLALVSVLAFAAVGTSLVPARAGDDSGAEVKKHFSLANDLYKEQKYGDALIEYDAAYELSHNFKILYNRGQCLVMVKREPEAIDTFKRYLTDGAKAITDERRAEVEAYIKELEARLGGILVTGAPDGAVIEVDGRVAATTPLAHAIPAGAGSHEIVARPPGGGVPVIQKVSVIAGKEVTLKVELGAPVAAPLPAPAPAMGAGSGFDVPPPAPPPPPSQRPPTGLLSPSFMLTALVGAAAPTNDSKNTGAARTALGVFELGASWRLNSFWELGGFAAFAAGGKNQGDATATGTGTGTGTGTSATTTNGDYAYGNYGLRLRLHPVRGRKWDGWLGFDLGRFVETWKNTGTSNFTAQGAALGIGFGVDFSVARAWALGGSLRYLSSTVSCSSGDSACDSLGIAGTRGFVELGVRLVWVLPYGQPRAAETTAASLPNGLPNGLPDTIGAFAR